MDHPALLACTGSQNTSGRRWPTNGIDRGRCSWPVVGESTDYCVRGWAAVLVEVCARVVGMVFSPDASAREGIAAVRAFWTAAVEAGIH